ncbi:MAG TPA: phosphoribosylanthranilate isomerase [Candidatus Thermoplasmatota archaeon]|nr:phosphoribosylanthranilate isomerase [Candidatus Thermoplasmatota archaeon]
MTRVKICGLTRAEDVHAARAADAVGFVVASPESPREVGLERARTLADLATPFQVTYAVTVTEDPKVLETIVETVRPQALQLHGRVEPRVVEGLRRRNPALRFVLSRGVEHEAGVPEGFHALHLDARAEGGYGGTGRPLDLARAARIVERLAPTPVIVAGGLTPENVAAAVQTTGAYAVDVASGVESAPGRKDAARVRAFIAAARGAGA